MNIIGFVPQQYVIDAICESRFKREQSARRNYQRNVYESIEYNDDRFEVMLDDEIRKIKQFNRYRY